MGNGNAGMHLADALAIVEVIRFVMEDDDGRLHYWPAVVTLLYIAGEKIEAARKGLPPPDRG